MRIVDRLLSSVDRISPPLSVSAHCDLPCGVYDPAQARIEAESVKACMEKFNGSDDEVFKERAVVIKEERAELVKHHLWVLWTDYFKPEHLAKHPQLHDLFWKATKAAGRSQEDQRPQGGTGAARPDQGDRHNLLGDQEGVSQPAPRAGPRRGNGSQRSASGRCCAQNRAVGARASTASSMAPPQASHCP